MAIMRLEIDTQHDSPETIRKAIELLRTIVGSSAYSNAGFDSGRDIFGSPSKEEAPKSSGSSSGEGLFGNIFESSSKSQENIGITSEAPAEDTDEEEEVPEIIPY